MREASITRDEVAEAMQMAWNAFVGDTGCFPDCFTAEGAQVIVFADFSRGNFAQMVADWLNRPAGGSEVPW